ncbi:carbamoyl phosphate synthase small subunit [Pullulanibacillus sp. KACC 23026]|uniref:carbamoyl phosphate synthase small subunit n=1 Tax=Pullulanibacillus sp. KACC 23026 TaxID=3028315 RepID=UPI0023B1091E|nr:carbamoyl phosphate synthase small subunit [Pullulanibacillus sp. KACC 23026]WEG11640.1 carbamoyl phosphate synthase small subunit [Pullulanibacillus sp. KACC 23026]
MKRQLILENGAFFVGEGFGSSELRQGEVVFNTGMTGYQEILSDPSYCDQIVTLTYPLIGNYGINRDDFESISPAVAGLIVKELEQVPSHWRSEYSLHDMLVEKGIPGLAGIDTRRLTKLVREFGTLKGRLCDMDADPERVAAELCETSFPTDQVFRVSTKVEYNSPGLGQRVVIMDFGMKKGILREALKTGFDIVVVPHTTPAQAILHLHPDGVLLTNGPGDPTDVPHVIETVRELLGKVPLFGICLGHQLIALASGATTKKMKFGHRGSNHPVKDLDTGRFYMTSQNHSYTVDPESLSGTGLRVSHVAINDGTIEGLKHTEFPAFSVQFHPEASPGPEDSRPLFEEFKQLIEESKKKVGVLHA